MVVCASACGFCSVSVLSDEAHIEGDALVEWPVLEFSLTLIMIQLIYSQAGR